MQITWRVLAAALGYDGSAGVNPRGGYVMHYLLAGSQIRLTYLQDRRALAGIDWPTVFDDLTDAGMTATRWQWCDLDRLTHVVLATDRVTGRYAGVLGLTEWATPLEPWLMIDVALVRPKEIGVTLPRAMLAHVLARIVCLDGKPLAVAASPANRPVLSDLGRNLRSVALHPPPVGNVITLRAASLARQIGIGRTALVGFHRFAIFSLAHGPAHEGAVVPVNRS